MSKSKLNRILLKISGESFKGDRESGIDPKSIKYMANEIKSVVDLGIEIGVVVGGGNIWRGAEAEKDGMDRATADYAGMLATIINAVALQDSLERKYSIETVHKEIYNKLYQKPVSLLINKITHSYLQC